MVNYLKLNTLGKILPDSKCSQKHSNQVEEDWISFIIQRFQETGKHIEATSAAIIVNYCENHSYYVQQLAQQAWLRSSKNYKPAVIQEAFEDLIMQISMLFQMLTDESNMKLINFLDALCNNEEQLTSQNVLKRYNLGTSANVIKIKNVLHDREIIDIVGKKIQFMDPLYKYWLKNYYLMPG